MNDDIDLEGRLRSYLAAERRAYEPPPQLASHIRQAIRSRSVPARRQALLPQLAIAAGLILVVAVLSVGAAWIRNGGPSPTAGRPVTSPTAVTYRIATRRSDFYLLALVGGVLRGKANPDGTACLWLGDGSERMVLLWPSGYSARGNPLSVYDQSGALVGVVGQRVSLGGGPGPDDVRNVSVLGCTGFSAVWGVSPK